ncbi:MAG: tetratricopeptide repeat protein [Pseudomonadota bacterium]
MAVTRSSLCLAAALWFSGCATLDTANEDAGSATVPATKPSAPTTVPLPPYRAPDPADSNAWRSLLDQAQQAATRGDYERALVLLERAQRIEPGAGVIYLEQARLHLIRGDLAQARSTAERGLLYCDNPDLCDALRDMLR